MLKMLGFVCGLYGYDDMKVVHLLRYKLFCAKKGNCPRFKLPPCRSSLSKTALCTCKLFIKKFGRLHHLEVHGWVAEGGELFITWMDCNAAPDREYRFSIYRKQIHIILLLMLNLML